MTWLGLEDEVWGQPAPVSGSQRHNESCYQYPSSTMSAPSESSKKKETCYQNKKSNVNPNLQMILSYHCLLVDFHLFYQKTLDCYLLVDGHGSWFI